MKRAAARVAASFALASTAALMLSSVAAFAQILPGNPAHHYGEISNPGHHYGQQRHHPPAPSPTPNPVPTPNPMSTPNPASKPSQPPTGSGAHGTNAGTPASHASLGVANAGVGTIGVPAQDQRKVRAVTEIPGSPIWLDWLILLVLPVLLAVWAIVATRIVRNSLRTLSPVAV